MGSVSIEGLDKASVLAALYNASTPLGMGFLQYDPTPMNSEEAQELLAERTYFDHLKGRVMKVNLEDDKAFDSWGYNRDIGDGAAERVVAELRATNEVQTDNISAMHESGKADAATIVRENFNKPSTFKSEGGITTLELGLADMVDVLGPAVDRAT